MDASPVEVMVAVLITAFFIAWLVLQAVKDFRNRSVRTVSVGAVLLSKHEEDFMTQQVFVGRSQDMPAGDGSPDKRRLYVLEFEDENRQSRSFEVEESVYLSAEEGARGILVYREDEFVSFGSLKGGRSKRTV